MFSPASPDVIRRRRLIMGVTVALVTIAFIIYSVLLYRAHSAGAVRPAPPTGASSSTTVSPGAVKPVPSRSLPALRMTRDPGTFAREVAEALFSWDTATMVGRADHIEQLIKSGDPTGESTAGLLSDLDDYLPTPDAWADLAQYETQQWLVIKSVTTPTKWGVAETQAGTALLPGTTALTVRGVRHRSGVWEETAVTSAHDVAFTVFMACGPSYPECHLLRLSVLDKPLG